MSERNESRRHFLKSAIAAGTALPAVPFLLNPEVAGAAPEKSPNEKLNLAAIGVDGRGGANLNGCKNENIVALCDIDSKRLGVAAKKFPKAKHDTDFRKTLDRNDLDGVIVSTPDHFHAVATAAALKKRLPVYCEKPLTYTVHEAQVIRKLAKKANVATQMGNQIHSSNNYRRVVELVEQGVIGKVNRVHVWVNSPRKLSGKNGTPKAGLSQTNKPPANLNYDLWLGPAQFRNYHESHVHFNWRYWWDFGNGQLGDFGCHFMDLPFWALKLKTPDVVHSTGSKGHDEINDMPQNQRVEYYFPQRGELSKVHMTWYHGDEKPEWLGKYKKRTGVLFEGTNGKLLADYHSKRLFFEGDQQAVVQPYIPNSPGHHQEWINAIKNGTPTGSNFEYATDLTETVLLGNVSYRAGKKELKWDSEKGKVTNNVPEAAQFIEREYRKGWAL